jgi:hypothetical protein
MVSADEGRPDLLLESLSNRKSAEIERSGVVNSPEELAYAESVRALEQASASARRAPIAHRSSPDRRVHRRLDKLLILFQFGAAALGLEVVLWTVKLA